MKTIEGIIRPIKGKRDPQVGPDALMVMTPAELKYLVLSAGAEEVPFTDSSLYHLYQTNGLSGQITLTGPFIGAPHAVIAMEKIIALGAKRIWVLGWCGSLQDGLKVGDFIIPVSAVSEEGTSQHYPIPNRVPESDSGLNRILETSLKRLSLPFTKGAIWTTDAIYRETTEKVISYQTEGVLAVEMEISALMTVAIYRSVALAALLVVSDELSDLTWRPGFSVPLLRKSSRQAGDLLLNLARTSHKYPEDALFPTEN